MSSIHDSTRTQHIASSLLLAGLLALILLFILTPFTLAQNLQLTPTWTAQGLEIHRCIREHWPDEPPATVGLIIELTTTIYSECLPWRLVNPARTLYVYEEPSVESKKLGQASKNAYLGVMCGVYSLEQRELGLRGDHEWETAPGYDKWCVLREGGWPPRAYVLEKYLVDWRPRTSP